MYKAKTNYCSHFQIYKYMKTLLHIRVITRPCERSQLGLFLTSFITGIFFAVSKNWRMISPPIFIYTFNPLAEAICGTIVTCHQHNHINPYEYFRMPFCFCFFLNMYTCFVCQGSRRRKVWRSRRWINKALMHYFRQSDIKSSSTV